MATPVGSHNKSLATHCHTPHTLIFGGFKGFSVKRSIIIFRQKMVHTCAKSDQNWSTTAQTRYLSECEIGGTLVPLVYHGGVHSYEPLSTPFRACVPPRTSFICPDVPHNPQRVTLKPHRGRILAQSGPKWGQYRST